MDAHVEKSKEDPIPTRKLLMMVNDYVVNSTRFVNRFHAVTEEKLQNVSRRIGQTVSCCRWLGHCHSTERCLCTSASSVCGKFALADTVVVDTGRKSCSPSSRPRLIAWTTFQT